MAGRWAMLLVPVLALGCSGGRTAAPAAPSTPTEQPAPAPAGPNTLTDAERAAGWRLLFDGRTTAGWRGFRQPAVPDGWQPLDDALTRVGAAGDLITADEFASFELTVEWQISEGGNSGIMYRVSEAIDPTFFSGPDGKPFKTRDGTAITLNSLLDTAEEQAAPPIALPMSSRLPRPNPTTWDVLADEPH